MIKDAEETKDLTWDVFSNDPLPEQWLEFKETKAELQSFIKHLDDTTRQILMLKNLDDNLKFSDIAQILNINVSTVKTKYQMLLAPIIIPINKIMLSKITSPKIILKIIKVHLNNKALLMWKCIQMMN